MSYKKDKNHKSSQILHTGPLTATIQPAFFIVMLGLFEFIGHIPSASLSPSPSAVSLGGWWHIRLSDKFRWGLFPHLHECDMAAGERRPDLRWHEQTASCQTCSPSSLFHSFFFPSPTFDLGSFSFSPHTSLSLSNLSLETPSPAVCRDCSLSCCVAAPLAKLLHSFGLSQVLRWSTAITK